MKRRNGFVSNSSTSSFIIYFKGTREQLKTRLIEVFKVPEDYPIKEIAKEMSETIISCLEQDYKKGISTLKDYLTFMEDEYGGEPTEKALQYLQEEFSIYPGNFSNEGYDNALEPLLCDTDIYYKSDDLIIEHRGGF